MCVVKGCSVGLKDAKGHLIGKGWKLATTHELLAEWMQLPCVCGPNSRHVPCEGKLTRESAYYTDMFAKRVAAALKQGCLHEHIMQDMLQPIKLPPEDRRTMGKEQARTGEETANSGRRQETCECELIGHPCSDVCCATCERAKDLETSMCLAGESETQPLSRQERDRAIRQIGLLHRATGHAPVEHVVRTLTRRGTDPRIIGKEL